MKNILNSIVAAISEKTELGAVDVELVNELEALKKEKVEKAQEIEDKVNVYIKEMRSKYTPIQQDLKDRHDAAWDKIYDYFGLTEKEREGTYTIDENNMLIRVDIDPGLKKMLDIK